MHFTESDIQRNASDAGYLPVAVEDVRGFAAASLAGTPDFSLADLLRSADAPGVRVCKDRPKIRAVCTGGLFFKQYRIRGWWKLFRYRFRTPRPFRALQAALDLKTAGITTPEVLIALRGDAHDGIRNDCLVTAELPGGTLFADRIVREQGAAAIEALIGEITSIVAVMHAAGIEHGDLNLRNLYRIPDTTEPGAFLRWGVIDLDGVRIAAEPVAVSRRCRETARLATSIWLALPPEEKEGTPWEEVLECCALHYEDHAGVRLPRWRLRRAARRLLTHDPRRED